MPAAQVRIAAFGPTRPWFAPGCLAQVEVELLATTATTVRATFELVDLDRVLARIERSFRVPAARSRRAVSMALPVAARHGYGLRVELAWNGGRAAAASAVEALDGWWESPRHAAITEFQSPARTARAVTALRAWHVTVVQDYDWMYRHYRYEPPAGDTFVDALGRHVSHAAVRAGIRAGHRAGIATLAYGSVYGAEREYVDEHPDERVFDGDGAPVSLGETFYINDLRPNRPWRRRLLAEYAHACRRFGFDGIHMDTYGPPHAAIAADGQAIDFAGVYPGLIAEAATTVASARRGGRVLFNCVEGFPLQQVARAATAALYLELWPPDAAYGDIARWIDRARQLGEGRAVVIAAYISALRTFEGDPRGRAGAIEAAVLLTSVIAAAGAYHHVLADDDRLLVEGYYPEARRLRSAEARELRSSWAFSARYVHLLSDPGLRSAGLDGVALLDAEGRRIQLRPSPEAGSVWARSSVLPDGTCVLQLVDLLDQADDRWDAIRQASPTRIGWRLRWPGAVAPLAMSPWTAAGAPSMTEPGNARAWVLPAFRRWLMVADPRSLRAEDGPASLPT
jgi:dextranase